MGALSDSEAGSSQVGPSRVDNESTPEVRPERIVGGRYRLHDRLGEGASGVVWKAQHLALGKSFALKLLHPEVAADNDSRARFEREAAVLGRLQHLGTGAAALGVAATTLGFGSVNTGISLDRTLTVRNTGGGVVSGAATLTGTGFTLIGPSSYSLGVNQAQVITVRYAPTAAGSSTGTLTLTGGGGGTVALTGIGRSSGAATATPNLETGYPWQVVTVTIANGPGSRFDWVAMYVSGAADTTYLSWKYLNGSTTAPATGLTSATLTFQPPAVGAYEFRFFSNNTYTLLARSTTVATQTTLPPGSYAYTGREWDQETGLYYYRARCFDPKIGRFLSEDPVQFDGGVNFYSYVFNNPVNLKDPLGLQAFPPPQFREPMGKCAARIFSRHTAQGHHGRQWHCIASCEIVKECGEGGRIESALAGWGKEWLYDVPKCLFTLKGCSSAAQGSDFDDNYRGRSCPANQTCVARCQGLSGNGPPGWLTNYPNWVLAQ